MAVRYISRLLVQTAPAGVKPDDPLPPGVTLPGRVVVGIPNALRSVSVRTGFHLMPDDPSLEDCRRQVFEILRPLQESPTAWAVELAAQGHLEFSGVWVHVGNGLLFSIGTIVDGTFQPYATDASGIGPGIRQTYFISFQPE